MENIISAETAITVKQLPELKAELLAVSEQIKEITEEACSLICTEDTVKAVKAKRAELNKAFQEYEKRRIEVKEQILEPYNVFNDYYKEYVADIFKGADSTLAGKIASVEDTLKKEKCDEIMGYFAEYRESVHVPAEFAEFEDSRIKVTLTASMKSLKEAARKFIDKVAEDLAIIGKQESPDEVLVEYKKTRNVLEAITAVDNRRLAIARAQEEREKAEADKKHDLTHADMVAAEIEAVSEPIVVEKPRVMTVTLEISGTKEQLSNLKKYMDTEGITYVKQSC